MSTCKIPPDGWYCTREAGHENPCAALSISKYYWMIFECLSPYGRTKWECVSEDHPFSRNSWRWAEQYGKPMLLTWKEITREEYLIHPDCEDDDAVHYIDGED